MVVAGAGPSGLVTAALLARGGHPVLLAERAVAFPAGPMVLTGPGLVVLRELGWLEALAGLPGAARCRRLVLGSERDSVRLDDGPELVVVPRAAALGEMSRRVRESGVEILLGWAALAPVWDGRRAVGLRVRDGEGREETLAGAVVVDATGPACAIPAAVGQLLPRRGPRRVRVVSAVHGAPADEAVLAARSGYGLLLLPGGHLIAVAQCADEGPPPVGELVAACSGSLAPEYPLEPLGPALLTPRVGTLLLTQAGEGWVAIGEAAGCGAPWLPGRTSTGLAVAATAAWEIDLALRNDRQVGPGQLGATLSLTRRAVRLELLFDRALSRAATVGLLASAVATDWRRRCFTILTSATWAPVKGGVQHLVYLWWLDLATRRARRRQGRRG